MTKEKIFDDGNNYMNLEVMYPKSNVINYDPNNCLSRTIKVQGGKDW